MNYELAMSYVMGYVGRVVDNSKEKEDEEERRREKSTRRDERRMEAYLHQVNTVGHP